VQVQQTISGVVVKHALCAACAAGFHMNVSMEDLLKGFLGSVFEMAEQTQKSSEKEPTGGAVCRNCGLTYSAFRKNGKFGCAECYDAFRPHVGISLKNVHGATVHEGKLPGRIAAGLIHKREIERCKAALRKAVEQENYEEAARLRDHIKQLEADSAVAAQRGDSRE